MKMMSRTLLLGPLEAPMVRAWLAVAVSLLFLASCRICVPIPVSRNVARIKGIRQPVPKLDGVKEGITTRRELEQLLTPFVTSASDQQFLWARWEQVSSPIACSGTSDSDRDWGRVNVLAISDASGVLKYYRRCSEGEVLGCLAFMADNISLPPPDSDAIRFFVSHQGTFVYSTHNDFFGEAVFDKAGLHLQQTYRGFQRLNPPINFEVATTQIEKLEIKDSGYAEAVDIKLRFKPGTKPVEELTSYQASARDAWRLVWYVRSVNPLLLGVRSR